MYNVPAKIKIEKINLRMEIRYFLIMLKKNVLLVSNLISIFSFFILKKFCFRLKKNNRASYCEALLLK